MFSIVFLLSMWEDSSLCDIHLQQKMGRPYLSFIMVPGIAGRRKVLVEQYILWRGLLGAMTIVCSSLMSTGLQYLVTVHIIPVAHTANERSSQTDEFFMLQSIVDGSSSGEQDPTRPSPVDRSGPPKHSGFP